MNLTEAQVAYILAQIALLNCERAGMEAENIASIDAQLGIKYGDAAFDELTENYESMIGHDAILEMTNRNRKQDELMGTFAKCSGQNCQVREDCLRYTKPAVEDQHWHSFYASESFSELHGCDYILPVLPDDPSSALREAA